MLISWRFETQQGRTVDMVRCTSNVWGPKTTDSSGGKLEEKHFEFWVRKENGEMVRLALTKEEVADIARRAAEVFAV